MSDAPKLTGDDVRKVVAFLASVPMQISLEAWQEPSRTLLHAADEIDRLRERLADCTKRYTDLLDQLGAGADM